MVLMKLANRNHAGQAKLAIADLSTEIVTVPRLIWHGFHGITLLSESLLMPGKPNTLRHPSSRSVCGHRNKPRGGSTQGFSLTLSLTFPRILGDFAGTRPSTGPHMLHMYTSATCGRLGLISHPCASL